MNAYIYPSTEPNVNLHVEDISLRWSRYTVDFPTAHPTRYEQNNTVRGEYFQPRKAGTVPLAILLHGIGDHSVIPCKLLARALVKKGVASFILYSVSHSSRMPGTLGKGIPTLTPEEWLESYQVSVIDVCQVIDWVSSRAELDKERVAVIGVSLGGFVSAIAMAVDKRIKAGVFVVTGGNSEVITWKSWARVIKKAANCTETECHEIRRHYAEYLAQVAEKGFENVTPIKECFLTDPLTFASYLRQRPILMVNALWDEFIPRRATLDLWKAFDKPDIVWLPAAHASIWLWYPLISKKITGFLRATFAMQGGGSVA